LRNCYAISRSIDARVAMAALKAALRARLPPKGCIHHSDRGSQYASETYRNVLADHGLVGSMGRRGNPFDNAKAESFMKTLKATSRERCSNRSLSGVKGTLTSAGH
jgi:putative transposase